MKLHKVNEVQIDEELGLVFGFAIICTINGEPYYDRQEEHIPEEVMLKASLDFMQNSQMAKEMHEGEEIGTVVFAYPLTAEIAKSLSIETPKTGLLITMKPNEDVLKKFKDGTLTGFSVGGSKYRSEVLDG